MSELKVGDKVRVVSRIAGGDVMAGSIVNIDTDRKFPVCVDLTWCGPMQFGHDELEVTQ